MNGPMQNRRHVNVMCKTMLYANFLISSLLVAVDVPRRAATVGIKVTINEVVENKLAEK